jgi:hypothetical protein
MNALDDKGDEDMVVTDDDYSKAVAAKLQAMSSDDSGDEGYEASGLAAISDDRGFGDIVLKPFCGPLRPESERQRPARMMDDKPIVHKVEDMLKSSCGMDSTSARFLAIDIVKTVMHDFGVEMPMEFGPKKKARGVDKNERITTLTEEVDVLVGRLQQENVPAIRATLDSIAVMPTIKQLIVGQLDSESVKAINKGTNSTNMEHRRDNMTKVIFSQQMAAIAATEGKLKLAKEAMQLRVELGMVREYCSDNGAMNWEALHDDLLARIGA